MVHRQTRGHAAQQRPLPYFEIEGFPHTVDQPLLSVVPPSKTLGNLVERCLLSSLGGVTSTGEGGNVARLGSRCGLSARSRHAARSVQQPINGSSDSTA